MEDDADRVTLTGAQPADAMPKTDAVRAARSSNGAMMYRESDGITLTQRYHFRPRLHARTLLGEHKLAPGEVPSRLR